jgi:hypothetical protein
MTAVLRVMRKRVLLLRAPLTRVRYAVLNLSRTFDRNDLTMIDEATGDIRNDEK